MANFPQLQFWIDADDRLNLYFEDYVSGELDTWIVVHKNGISELARYQEEMDDIAYTR